MEKKDTIKLTDFAMRHFDKKFGGTKIFDHEPKEFGSILNKFKNLYFSNQQAKNLDKESVNIIDGYAPFCKILVMRNFTDAKTGTLPINLENYQYIRSGYSSRRDCELPVLSRWLELPLGAPVAKYLLAILYSKEQIDKESIAMYNEKKDSESIESMGIAKPMSFNADYGVVAILAQMTPKEEPINPATMVRNHLGVDFGGSGFKIDEFEYKKSVEFWEKNIIVK